MDKEHTMNAAIIGAGNVGGALAKGFTGAGHAVTISSATGDKASVVASETGARAAGSNAEAVRDAGIVVLAVPRRAAPAIVEELGTALDGKVLVDATNQLNDDYGDLVRWDESVAEQLAGLTPAAVVKAFNTVFAADMPTGSAAGEKLDGYFAGDDPAAKAAVAALLGSLGFRPIDVGDLRKARALEAMALVNIGLQLRNGWPWQSGFKLVGPTE
jgi:8-hydroxy-5-deazaflavin:NADPH oxidoreductase